MLNRTDVATWSGLLAVILIGGVTLLMGDSTANGLRIALYGAALLTPIALLWILSEEKQDWRPYLGATPEIPLLMTSAALGLLLWLIVWWGMDFLNHELVEAVGRYIPETGGTTPWAVEVIQTTLLIPFALSLLIFGLMRLRLSQLHRLSAALMMAAFFAVLCMITAPYLSQNTPRGMIGFIGYLVIGLAASLISLHTDSLWTGFALVASFMYANLAFLFELLERQIGVDYWARGWLLPVMLCAFGVLVLSQVIRFRTLPPSPRKKSDALSGMGWLALVVLLMVWVFLAVDEMDARNEAGSEPPAGVIEG